jgi:hypothetical protein
VLNGPLEISKRKKFLKLYQKVFEGIKSETYSAIIRFMAKIDCYEYVSLVKPSNKGKNKIKFGE